MKKFVKKPVVIMLVLAMILTLAPSAALAESEGMEPQASDVISNETISGTDAVQENSEPAVEDSALNAVKSESGESEDSAETIADEDAVVLMTEETPQETAFMALSNPEPQETSYTVTFKPNWPKKSQPGDATFASWGETESAISGEGGYVTLTKNGFGCRYDYSNPPGKETFEFSGWATSTDGDPVYGDEAYFVLEQNMTLYATWNIKEKDRRTIKKQPRANTFTYDGQEHALIEAGSFSESEWIMYYYLYPGDSDASADGISTEYATKTPPTATDAGTYKVGYGYADYAQTTFFREIGTLECHIEKADINAGMFDFVAPKDNWDYDGEAHKDRFSCTLKTPYSGLEYELVWKQGEAVIADPKDAGYYSIWVKALDTQNTTNFYTKDENHSGEAVLKPSFYIGEAELKFEPDGNKTKGYGTKDPQFKWSSCSGLVGNETLTYEGQPLTREGAGEKENVGNYKIIANTNLKLLDDPDSGFKASNYKVAGVIGEYNLSIKQMNINDSKVTIDYQEEVPYSGTDTTKPNITITFQNDVLGGPETLEEGSNGDYDVTYNDGIFTVIGKRNFNDTAQRHYNVVSKNIEDEDITITPIADKTYSGVGLVTSNLENEIKLVYATSEGPITLTKDTDYTIEWPTGQDYTDTGKKTYTIKGKGNYTGEYKGTFEIKKKDPAAEDFQVTAPENCEYDGQGHKATALLKQPYTGCNFEIKYKNSKGGFLENEVIDPGTYIVCIDVDSSGTNFNPTDEPIETSYSFTISKKSVTVTFEPAEKAYGMPDPAYEYNVEGLLPGDDVEVTFGREEGEGPGEYKVISYTFTGPDKDKYDSKASGGVFLTITEPEFTEGQGSEYATEVGKDLTFRATGYAEKLIRVLVDDKEVDPSNYTVKSGSTIITLKASYLETLTVGKHTLTAVYRDEVWDGEHVKTAEFRTKTDFVVKTTAAKSSSSDDRSSKGAATGDHSNVMVWLVLLIAAACVLLTFGKVRRNK